MNNLRYYNCPIGFTDRTTKLLDDLESLGCPNVRVAHGKDGVIFASNSTNPTYGDVLGWLMDKGYIINIEPCSTFASANHNAWWWVLNVCDVNDAYPKRKYTDIDMYCKWDECAAEAIKKAVELIKKA